MNLFKQPWFIMFLFIISVYTYRFYQNPQHLELSLNTAEATADKKAPETAKEAAELPRIPVNINEFFDLNQVRSFHLSTYYNMEVNFEKSKDDKILFLLKGESSRYRNKGDKLADFFDIKTHAGNFKMESISDNTKNLSFKKLFKSKTMDDKSKLVLTIQVPETHHFQTIEVESVSSSLMASNIQFDNFKTESVSGDVKLTKCTGDSIEIGTVSGSSNIEVADLKSGEFETVSGDTLLKSSGENAKLKFESVSGDLKLEMPKEADLDVHFESLTGELSNEFGTSKKAMSSLKFSSLSGSAKVSKIK